MTTHSASVAGFGEHPVSLEVDYPDRALNRVSTAFRPILALPILVILGAVSGVAAESGSNGWAWPGSAGGLLFAAPLLMIVFRRRYPRWWYDWNLELVRFSTRVGAYLALLDDRYPSTEDEQSVHFSMPHPDVERGDVHQFMPLVKWFLAIPHYVVLAFLWVGVVVAVIAAWFAILFTGRYPRVLFDYVVGVARWHLRVVAYAFALTTDEYPPFRLRP
jgi:hypothetical protein